MQTGWLPPCRGAEIGDEENEHVGAGQVRTKTGNWGHGRPSSRAGARRMMVWRERPSGKGMESGIA